MKLLKPWIASLLAFGFASMANAAPLQYQLTGTMEYHYIDDPFTDYDTTISMTFFYDPTAPLTSTGIFHSQQVDIPYSYYTGSITQISGSVSNYTFSGGTADAIVQTCPATYCMFGVDVSITTNVSGIFAKPGSAAYSSLHGFSIDDFSLVNVEIDFSQAGFDQPLPISLPPSVVTLSLENSLGERRAYYFRDTAITPVPLPGSFFLFASGLIGLGANLFRKPKR